MTGLQPDAIRDAATMAYRHADDLPRVRAFVRTQSAHRGLPADPVEAMALAVSELATNTLQHTTGGGEVRVWAAAGSVFCDVVDSGPLRTFGRSMPEPEADRGRGLVIVEYLCDEVTAFAEGECTVVRMRFAVEPGAGPVSR